MPEQEDWLVVGVHADGTTEVLSRRPTKELADVRASTYRREFRTLRLVEVMHRSKYHNFEALEEPMSERNGTVQSPPHAENGGRRATTEKVRAWLTTLPPETKFSEASAKALELGLPLSQSAFYRWRDVMKGAAAPSAAPPAAASPRRSPPPGRPPAAAASTAAPPAIDALRELAQVVYRLGGVGPCREALGILEDLAKTMGVAHD